MPRPIFQLLVRMIEDCMPSLSERIALLMRIWCQMREFSSQFKVWIAKLGVLSESKWCLMMVVLPLIIWCQMREVVPLLSSKVCSTALLLLSIMNFIIWNSRGALMPNFQGHIRN